MRFGPTWNKFTRRLLTSPSRLQEVAIVLYQVSLTNLNQEKMLSMERTILFGGSIYDPVENCLTNGSVIVIQGERIEAVDSVANLQAAGGDGRVIDVEGKTILPSLIDLLGHVVDRANEVVDDRLVAADTIDGLIGAGQAIEMGITIVRDTGCKHSGIYALQKAIADEQIIGPRLFVAGLIELDVLAGESGVLTDGPWRVRKAIRQRWKDGANWIRLIPGVAIDASHCLKVNQSYSNEEIIAAVAEAHAKGLRISCYCETKQAASSAIAAGVDCIEQGVVLNDEMVAQMARQGVHYIPNFWMNSMRVEWGDVGPDQTIDYEARWAEHPQSLQRALAVGVTIGVGTDSISSVAQQDCLVRELKALIDTGMSPAQALGAATINGARILGLEDQLGSIEPGKLADIIVVDGNPLEEIRALTRPRLVMKAGKILVDSLAEGDLVTEKV